MSDVGAWIVATVRPRDRVVHDFGVFFTRGAAKDYAQSHFVSPDTAVTFVGRVRKIERVAGSFRATRVR